MTCESELFYFYNLFLIGGGEGAVYMQRHVMKKQLSTFTIYYYFESVFEFTGFLCYLISADFVSVFVCLTAERNQKPLARAPSPPSNRLKSHHPPRSLPLPSELAALHLHQPTSRGKPDLPLISFPPIFYTFHFFLPSAYSLTRAPLTLC